LGYLALEDEPCLLSLFEAAIGEGRRVFMPLADANWRLRFVRWTPADATRASLYGRWVPTRSEEPVPEPSVVLIPARAFDREGYRLGRGKGCYDRSFDVVAALGATVGVIYHVQLASGVPREPHDRAVDLVVTDRETIHTRGLPSLPES
jgi:5-formyltetrahydrofolate cyclo-ligase